jgi:penicillin-binding protein 1C
MALAFSAGRQTPARVRLWVLLSSLMLGVLGLLGYLDSRYPLPRPGRASPYALVVLAADGTPLRAFPDQGAVWRYPVKIGDVAPSYLDALIGYEDRGFYYHPGVNPVALARAALQWLGTGHIVSGGSTLSMQVARIIDPTPRTMRGKLHQIARALQLEAHDSKSEILTIYLNYAPMGGVLEGVEAASRGYLGKSSHDLSASEAALLAVLPQRPSDWRPDRYPERARIARDKVLNRMQGRWSKELVEDAISEPVVAISVREPLLAPLLAERLKRGRGTTLSVTSTIDAHIQEVIEHLLSDRVRVLPPHVSMAALVLDNRTGAVLGYAGSADFGDGERFNYIDMVRAERSPGSALKPFLYGFALDAGLIHSESLLSDVPRAFSGYAPANFEQSFHGAVSVSEALVQSLNVPAVEVLDAFGPKRFVDQLDSGGLKLKFACGASANLSVILGGAGVTLENMVGSYAALARGGVALEPRLTPDQPLIEHRMMSEGAAFIVRDVLANGGRSGEAPSGRGGRGVAWKTGTSFGFRDAWAFGVTERYTIGVWVGRPDGTPNPGYFGANVAAPLLLNLFDAIPNAYQGQLARPPASVSSTRVCWPAGTRASGPESALCPVQRTAWILDDIAPPTFADPQRAGSDSLNYQVDAATGERVTPDCSHQPMLQMSVARWPVMLEPWLDQQGLKHVRLPAWQSGCAPSADRDTTLKIYGAPDGEVIQKAPRENDPLVTLEARGSAGEVDWIVNGRLIGHTRNAMAEHLKLHEEGGYDITALDAVGHYDRIHIRLQVANG